MKCNEKVTVPEKFFSQIYQLQLKADLKKDWHGIHDIQCTSEQCVHSAEKCMKDETENHRWCRETNQKKTLYVIHLGIT